MDQAVEMALIVGRTGISAEIVATLEVLAREVNVSPALRALGLS